MSESTTETTTAPEATAPTGPVFSDSIGQTLFDDYAKMVTELNGVTNQVKVFGGNPKELLAAMRPTASDSDVKGASKLRKEIDELQEALFQRETALDNLLLPVIEAKQANAAAELKPLEEKQAALRASVKTAGNFLTDRYGANILDTAPAIVGSRKSSAKSGEGNSRPARNYNIFVNGTLATAANKDGEQKSSLSAAAKVAKVETSVLQKAFIEAQGTTNRDDYKDRVEFAVTNADGEVKIVAERQTEAAA